MKKILLIFLMASLFLVGCNHKKKELKMQELNVENVISSDKEFMYLNYSPDYTWFETCILLKDYLDADADVVVAGISNVFQVVTQIDEGYDTEVILSSHTPTVSQVDVKKGFWVEDLPLDSVKLTFKEAVEKVQSVNYPKPHSKQVVLRKQLGPKNCNAQYIFGNVQSQLYVDAINGNVTDKNPAYE